jgi:hypothetical protein
MRIYASPLKNDAAHRTWSSIYLSSLFSIGRLPSAQSPKRTCVQNTLNLNLEPANGSGLDTSGTGALVVAAVAATVAAVVIAVEAVLGVGLTALSFPLADILAYQVSPLTL